MLNILINKATQDIDGVSGDEVTGYFPSSTIFYCHTAAGIQLKSVSTDLSPEITLTSSDAPVGLTIHVQFDESNTVANPKLTFGVESNGYTIVAGVGLSGSSVVVTPIGTAETTSWYPTSVVSLTLVQVSNSKYWVVNGYKNITLVSQQMLGDTGADSSSYHPILLKKTSSSTDEINHVYAASEISGPTPADTVYPPAYRSDVSVFRVPALEMFHYGRSKAIALVGQGDSANFDPVSTGWTTILELPDTTETVGSGGEYTGMLATVGMFRYQSTVLSTSMTFGQDGTTFYTQIVVTGLPHCVNSTTPIRQFIFSNGDNSSDTTNLSAQFIFNEVGTPVYISASRNYPGNYVNILDTSSVATVSYSATHQLTVTIYYMGPTHKIDARDSQIIFYFN